MSCTDHPWIEWWTEFKRLLRLRQPRICYRSALLYNPRRARTHKILRAEKTERSTWASHWRKELAKAFTYWKWWKCIVGLYKLIRERRISPCSQNFSVSHPQLLSSRWGRFYVIFRFFCLLWWFSFFFFFWRTLITHYNRLGSIDFLFRKHSNYCDHSFILRKKRTRN